jgi:hypothetical protein
LVLILICFGVVGGLRWYRNSKSYDAKGLFAMLPTDHATLFYADTELLRKAKVLDLVAGSKAAEEPDYQRFVEQTGFDYKSDLDAVAAAFRGKDSYFALRGHFQWKRLEEYARLQGGSCQYTVCSMPGSSPERNISFYPVTRTVLALAVSKETHAVSAISDRGPRPLQIPAEPVWISAPAEVLKETPVIPVAVKALLSPIAKADNLVVAIGLQGEQFQLRVEVSCRTSEVAAGMSRDLSSALQLIAQIAQQSSPTDDSSGLGPTLLSGTFQQHENHVTGTWPIQRRLMENIFSVQPE